ncbi:MAG: DUF3149 domain-containing protein [Kangiellaceae bacterium]|jgi:hypothetical protein|nr:DUF3149 domain-containing protein [Kangiellaceae bacterium]
MEIWKELLATPVGLLSLLVIVFMLVMAGYFIHLFLTNMRKPIDKQQPSDLSSTPLKR